MFWLSILSVDVKATPANTDSHKVKVFLIQKLNKIWFHHKLVANNRTHTIVVKSIDIQINGLGSGSINWNLTNDTHYYQAHYKYINSKPITGSVMWSND